MLTTNRVAAVALALLAIVVLFESRKLPLGSLHNPGPAYMPVLLALALLGLAILVAAWGGAGSGLRAVGWSELAPRRRHPRDVRLRRHRAGAARLSADDGDLPWVPHRRRRAGSGRAGPRHRRGGLLCRGDGERRRADVP